MSRGYDVLLEHVVLVAQVVDGGVLLDDLRLGLAGEHLEVAVAAPQVALHFLEALFQALGLLSFLRVVHRATVLITAGRLLRTPSRAKSVRRWAADRQQVAAGRCEVSQRAGRPAARSGCVGEISWGDTN